MKVTLYHGTSSNLLPDLLQNGIRPHSETGIKNWEGKLTSKHGLIYLSAAYPLYFSGQAVSKHKGLNAVVRVELDTDTHTLYPDEDWIARQLHRQGEFQDLDLDSLTAGIMPQVFEDHWQSSLEASGNVAALPVPPELITDHIIIPKEDQGWIMSLGADAVPTELNYMFMGSQYGDVMAKLFETKSAKQAAKHMQQSIFPPELLEKLATMNKNVTA